MPHYRTFIDNIINAKFNLVNNHFLILFDILYILSDILRNDNRNQKGHSCNT